MISTLKEQIKNPAPEASYVKGSRESVTGEVKILVRKEQIKFRGVKKTIRRLYVCDPITEEPGVGWIVDVDIVGCMVCGEPFGVFRWPHHCRCCGNMVCDPCSPEFVEVIELEKLGPVRVCVMCFWGQHPVHANFHLETFNTSDSEGEGEDADHDRKESDNGSVSAGYGASVGDKEVPEDSSSVPRKVRVALTPVPFFVVEFHRKLDYQELGNATKEERKKARVVFVNVCTHEAMLTLPEEQEFVVCDEVYTMNEAYEGLEEEADVYHALLRPDLIEIDFSEDNIDQFEEVSAPSSRSFSVIDDMILTLDFVLAGCNGDCQ